VAELQPELVLGTQMERHIAKRLGLPCAMVSAPMHVQDFPARHAPQMGFEGANVLFDTWVHPLMMGLEEHLLTMFRGDFEFHDGAAASHLGHGHAARAALPQQPVAAGLGQAKAAEAVVALVAAAAATTQAGAMTQAPRPGESSPPEEALSPVAPRQAVAANAPVWAAEATRELQKIPFFVRGKARRNTERFATERGLAQITVETLYDAKAHFGR